jgi:hypothetical protein
VEPRALERGGSPWLPELDALLAPRRRAAGAFPAEGDKWRRALEGTQLFAPLSRAEFDHAHCVDTDGFVALVASWSWIANLPSPERAAVLTRVRELAGDQVELTLRYRTEIHWTRLI